MVKIETRNEIEGNAVVNAFSSNSANREGGVGGVIHALTRMSKKKQGKSFILLSQ
jgi:hypothetical protein